jgi:hypothetical protein
VQYSDLAIFFHVWLRRLLPDGPSGFVLVNRYVVHSESPLSVHIAGFARPLLHDAILVLAPLAAGVARAWTAPLAVDQSGSRQFCYDCATLLGWLLNSDLSPPMIEQSWQRYLG